MKDEIYDNLLKEVKSRIFSTLVNPWNPSSQENAQFEAEMNRVKSILISSGHDLKDVNNFTSEILGYISDSLPK
jgi:hypothetical protein